MRERERKRERLILLSSSHVKHDLSPKNETFHKVYVELREMSVVIDKGDNVERKLECDPRWSVVTKYDTQIHDLVQEKVCIGIPCLYPNAPHTLIHGLFKKKHA